MPGLMEYTPAFSVEVAKSDPLIRTGLEATVKPADLFAKMKELADECGAFTDCTDDFTACWQALNHLLQKFCPDDGISFEQTSFYLEGLLENMFHECSDESECQALRDCGGFAREALDALAVKKIMALISYPVFTCVQLRRRFSELFTADADTEIQDPDTSPETVIGTIIGEALSAVWENHNEQEISTDAEN